MLILVQKLNSAQNQLEEQDQDEEFVLDDYESDNDNTSGKSSLANLGLSTKAQNLLKSLGIEDPGKEEDNQPVLEGPRIFYCSRTHSQLSQFANELRRVKLPPVIEEESPQSKLESSKGDLSEELKHLTLGSRKNLCINPHVNKLMSNTAINEKCLDLQKPGTPQNHKCPYIPSKDSELLVTQFRDHAISKIRDIEDLGKLGKHLGICPYYASRTAIPESEVSELVRG
jgi:chromosome transmission fidelity protein 1